MTYKDKGQRLKEAIMKRSVLLMSVLALCVWSVPALAGPSVGDVSMKMSYFGVGIGFQNGNATVKLNGKTGHFKVSGLHFLGGGISQFKGTGKVIGAKTLDDVVGEYSVTRASIAALVGGVSFNLVSDKGITIDISATNLGVDFSAGPGTITFSRK